MLHSEAIDNQNCLPMYLNFSHHQNEQTPIYNLFLLDYLILLSSKTQPTDLNVTIKLIIHLLQSIYSALSLQKARVIVLKGINNSVKKAQVITKENL